MPAAFRRISDRLRNSVQLLTQVTNNQIRNTQVVERWPDYIKNIADDLGEFSRSLRAHALEVDAFRGRQREDTDALITLADSTADVATIVGNIRILTHSDANYIHSLLIEADAGAMSEAIKRLSDEEKKQLIMLLEAQ